MGVAEKFRLANERMAEIMERASGETEAEKEIRRETVCVECRYAITYKKTTKERGFRYCDYVMVKKHSRPCAARDCVEAGVFERFNGVRRESPRPFEIWRIGG